MKDQTTQFSFQFKFPKLSQWTCPTEPREKRSLSFLTLNLFHSLLSLHFLYYLNMQTLLLSVTTSFSPATLLNMDRLPFYSLPSPFLRSLSPICFSSARSLFLPPLLLLFLFLLPSLSPLFPPSQPKPLFPTPFPLFLHFQPLLHPPPPLLSSNKSSSFTPHPTSFPSILSRPPRCLSPPPSHRFHRLNSSEPGRNCLTTPPS